MTQKFRQEALFTAPVSFVDRIEFHGPVTIRNLRLQLGSTVISPGKIIGYKAGALEEADSTDLDFTDSVVGMAIGSGYVATMGEVQIPSLWSWNVGKPLWLAANGNMTQAPPTEGFQLRIGLPTTPNTVMIVLGEPIVLA
jgi:hypothetical protein